MLNGVVSNYASIVRFTATDQDEGHIGDRIPGFWVNPGSTNLYINFDLQTCPSDTMTLNLNVWYSIEFKVLASIAYSYINGILQQACPITATILKYDNVIIYASDPWYPAASGMISNLVYENLDVSGDF